jgi:2-methylcitrate dehydratase PrpD
MACALGAYNTAAVDAVRRCVVAKAGRTEATLLGTDRKVPTGLAALVNGTMVRYLDANDIFVLSHGGASGHCSDGTPGLLAPAEQHRCSGKELLVCLVASYELQGALAETFHFRESGLHPLTHVAWTLPIVAARLIGATPVEAAHACGLCIATNTILNTWLRPTRTIPMIKGVAVGLVLERVLEAAELAGLGVTATEDAFEVAFSCLSSGGDSQVDPTPVEKLGRRWRTIRKYDQGLSSTDQCTGGNRSCPRPISTRCSRRRIAEINPLWQPKRLRGRPGIATSVCARNPGGGGP